MVGEKQDTDVEITIAKWWIRNKTPTYCRIEKKRCIDGINVSKQDVYDRWKNTQDRNIFEEKYFGKAATDRRVWGKRHREMAGGRETGERQREMADGREIGESKREMDGGRETGDRQREMDGRRETGKRARDGFWERNRRKTAKD